MSKTLGLKNGSNAQMAVALGGIIAIFAFGIFGSAPLCRFLESL